MQPPRGFGEDPDKIYHSPDCALTHHYLAFYNWLRDIWGADAMVHVGTHGSLEWLQAKLLLYVTNVIQTFVLVICLIFIRIG